MSLVVAIWDSDSTSRDDYIAGVRISLKEVQYFQKKELVWISLQAQLLDGHVSVRWTELLDIKLQTVCCSQEN